MNVDLSSAFIYLEPQEYLHFSNHMLIISCSVFIQQTKAKKYEK